MKGMRLVGSVVTAIFAAAALFTATASAAPPEFLKKAKFQLEGTNVIFKTVGGQELKCSSSLGSGEIIAEKSKIAKAVSIKFKGCKLALIGCKTAGAAAEEIVTKTLEGELGYIKPGKAGAEHVAFGLAPAVGTVVFQYECGTLIKKGEDTGCVAGDLSKAGVETNQFTLLFEETTGVQKIKAFEKTLNGEERKCTMEDKVEGTAAEGVGLETSLSMKTGAELEKIMS
jgi:hypothetical protein